MGIEEWIDEKINKYHKVIKVNNEVISFTYSRTCLGENRTALKVIEDLEQLKSSLPTQPELVEVLEFVADWYEANKDDLDYKIWKYCKDWKRHDTSDQFFKWMNDNSEHPIETLIRMKDGYTVKKEQLYYVKVGNLVFVDWEDSFVAKFATMNSLEWTSYAHKIHTKDGAENIARIIGGDAVPVGEEAE